MNDTQNFDNVMEEIEQSLYEINDGPCSSDTNSFLTLVREAYILVQWPDSQEYMEKDWFEDEAILALGVEDTIGGSAYFIPIKYLL